MPLALALLVQEQQHRLNKEMEEHMAYRLELVVAVAVVVVAEERRNNSNMSNMSKLLQEQELACRAHMVALAEVHMVCTG